MPRALVNPIMAVIAYFETINLEAGEQALAICKDMLRRRQQTGTKPTRAKVTTPRPATLQEAAPELPPADRDDPPLSPSKRRRGPNKPKPTPFSSETPMPPRGDQDPPGEVAEVGGDEDLNQDPPE